MIDDPNNPKLRYLAETLRNSLKKLEHFEYEKEWTGKNAKHDKKVNVYNTRYQIDCNWKNLVDYYINNNGQN